MKKICTKCKKEKSLSCFNKNISRKDGLNFWCKICWNNYRKQHRIKHNKRINEQQKVHYRKNRTRILKEHKRFNQTPKGRLNTYKNGAKRRKIEWDLTFYEFMAFWQIPCYYCGIEIKTIGLDRADPKKGYTSKNIVACCETCNIMKRDYTMEEFLININKIYENATKTETCS